jgi:Cu-Zn family superoxide dismutase
MLKLSLIPLFMAAATCAQAATDRTTVTMHMVDVYGEGKEVGSITITDSPYGALLTPALSGLPAGVHGFHVHEKDNCGPDLKDGYKQAGLAAGGHLDPQSTGRHEGPYGSGHLGDLPPLYATADGKADTPVLAPRLKRTDFSGHALMIHMGGDNYADQPKKLGGGGARLACGVVH